MCLDDLRIILFLRTLLTLYLLGVESVCYPDPLLKSYQSNGLTTFESIIYLLSIENDIAEKDYPFTTNYNILGCGLIVSKLLYVAQNNKNNCYMTAKVKKK